MYEMNRSGSEKRRRMPGIGMWIAVALIILLLSSVLVLYFTKFPGQDARQVSRQDILPESRHETFRDNMIRVFEIVSRMRINLLKSTDLEKGAVMAVTDEESQVLAEQSRKNADAVERDYQELKGLIDTGKIDKEMRLLKEFSDSWKNIRAIDGELLPLAVENTNIKAANLSSTKAAQAITTFERFLPELMDIPASDDERLQAAKLIYQAVTAAFMIYSLDAPHVNESEDKKKDELETLMGVNEKKVRNALRGLSRLKDRHGRVIFDNASPAFSKFMEVHKEVIRLSRMNTKSKALQLSLGRKRQVAAQCEEILSALQNAVQSRPSKAAR